MQPALSIIPASVRPQGAAVSRATGSRHRAKQCAVSGPPRVDTHSLSSRETGKKYRALLDTVDSEQPR